MSTADLSTFFALLTFACAAATVVAIGIAVAARVAGPESPAADLLGSLSDVALWLGFLVASVTMAGSLYYSIGAHFLPCELCWYQRICVYPLAVMLFVAAVRRDRRVWLYALPPAVIGVVIAAYHTQLQAFPDQRSFCDTANPCTNRYVWEYGFVSLPLMDLVALCFIITMTLIARAGRDEEVPAP